MKIYVGNLSYEVTEEDKVVAEEDTVVVEEGKVVAEEDEGVVDEDQRVAVAESFTLKIYNYDCII